MIRIGSIAVLTLGVLTLGANGAEHPRLAVLISIDQFRADYLERFQPYFGRGGFNRLRSGAVFTDCHHRHAATNTANGHATLATGVHAEIHGIIANEWLDPTTLQTVHSVADPAAPLVGITPSPVRTPLEALSSAVGASPVRLLAPTVGDQLKLRHRDRARVISVSNKDRAAILLGGRFADSAYWQFRSHFVTSRYYRPDLPSWVEAFNREGRVERDFGREWTRLLPAEVYDAVQGPDAAPGEESRHGLGTTFPRRVDGGAAQLSAAFHDAYRLTPFSSELLGEFAAAAVRGERLGQSPETDLLCVSFSQLDYCGHSFGPDSHEIMDSVIRLDRVLETLLAMLDEAVGAGRYLVVLSADHGVCPLPERVQSFGRGVPAGRFDAPQFDRTIESALSAAFGAPREGTYWALRDSNGYRFRRETLREKNLDVSRAAAVAAAALRQLPQVAAAFTREDLSRAADDGVSTAVAVRRSFHPDRSQDVVFVLTPYVVDRSPAGTNHSTPYAYDTHVPLVWYGAGVDPGARHDRVGTDQLAPTLCALLGIPAPPQARAERLPVTRAQ